MSNIKACLTSNTVHWATPTKLYNTFMDLGFIDPCPLHSEVDNLAKDFVDKRLFINPPFADLSKWCDFCIRNVMNGCDIYLLMPVRTDTKYFDKLNRYNVIACIYFITGRLHFNDSSFSAPFPTMILHLSKFHLFNLFHVYNLDDFCNILKTKCDF